MKKFLLLAAVVMCLTFSGLAAFADDDLGVAMLRYEKYYQADMKANKQLTDDQIFEYKSSPNNAGTYMPLASHYYGLGKYTESFPYYKKAAEAGSKQGALMLAISYVKGMGTNIHNGDGAKWMLAAADGGNPIAQYFMAHMYKEGVSVERSQTAVDKWFAAAAAKGVTDSTLN